MDGNDAAGYSQRFGGIGRLVGARGLERLRGAHVCVVGIGGVGSWAVEALARSGIGRLTLVDLDEVCVSNVNRQAPALDGEFGRPKVDVMARRAKAINPQCVVHPIQAFFTASSADELLAPGYDFVLDAIDAVANKCLLLARCRLLRLPVITVGGAGGRTDPTAIRVADLAFTSHDRLLQETRRRLRKEYNFSSDPKVPFEIECVYSPEPVIYPESDGTVCAGREPGSELRLDCESGYGAASFVTGAFGFAAAARVVQRLTKS